MNDIHSFLAASEEDKQENFERSSIKYVLRQLGLTAAQVKRIDHETGQSLTWDWFMDTYADIVFKDRVSITSTRVFNFNMLDLFLKPSSSPVVQMFAEERAKADSRDRLIVIFKAYEYGRMVITDAVGYVINSTYIHTSDNLYIMKADDFFAKYKNPLKDEHVL